MPTSRYVAAVHITTHRHQHISDLEAQLLICFCSGCHSTFNCITQRHPSMADLREIFTYSERREQPAGELPSQRIEAKVKLTKHVGSILGALRNDLRQHNMDRVNPDSTKYAISVSGTPPVNGFDEHTILAIVQRRDPGATLLS